jgi:hypothetical protein
LEEKKEEKVEAILEKMTKILPFVPINGTFDFKMV